MDEFNTTGVGTRQGGSGGGRGRAMTQPAWMTNPGVSSHAAHSTHTRENSDVHTHRTEEPVITPHSPSAESSTCTTNNDPIPTTTSENTQTQTPAQSQSQLQSQQQASYQAPCASVSSNSDTRTQYQHIQPQCQQYQQQYQQPQPQHQHYQQYRRQEPAAVAASAASSRLDQLLDAIDSTTNTTVSQQVQAQPTTGAGAGAGGGGGGPVVSGSPYDWSKHQDPASTLFYFYNFKTGVTQWEMPEGFIDYHVLPATATATAAAGGASSSSSGLMATSSFNAKTGAFASADGGSYWSQVGRQSDREGRQMAAFFDLDGFEQNREEAKRKKQELQTRSKRGEVDWRQHKEEAHQKRKRQKQAWLYDDGEGN